MATLSISVTVPDAVATDILVTITDYLGYVAGNGPRAEFLRLKVAQHLKGVYRAAKANAANSSVAQAEASADLVEFT